LLAILTYGEGYHNFHHIFTHDYRNGVRWWQWDPSKWLIGALEHTGLTCKLKRTPVFQIQRALLTMQFNRAQAQLAILPPSGAAQLEALRARIAHEYENFLAALADWARVKEEWLEEKKRAVLEQWQQVDLQSKFQEIVRRLSLQLRRMRVLQGQLA
jgi:stearoyl-CoA desaturase (delta-9 desaturase)